ncbi:MAG: GAF domain-containing sensor histidine kinase [Burkholderiaceae bacterium]
MTDAPVDPPLSAPEDAPEAIARAVALVSRIGAVPGILEVLCRNTRMGFAAVARVTDGTWTACAVRDEIGFGLVPGGQLDVHTTLCKEARAARAPVAFDHASENPAFRDHPTPRIYGIESYVSVPIILEGGEYFGNLCAIDPRPAEVARPEVIASFHAFAQLIARELQRERDAVHLEQELMDARASAVLREQFIAVLGHDLRNPLSAVMATAELMVRQPAAVDVAAVGRRLKSSAGRMSKLIDDVLDFARGRLGGGLSLRMQRDDGLAAALLEVVHEARQAHPGRDIDEQVDIARSARYDRGRLQQLLSNLVGNALHHGDEASPIRVAATVEADVLRLTVTNSGPGIAPSHLERVFEPYWRPQTSSPGGGLGLGLHICAQIAEAHGGRMRVTSADGVTCFTAVIPVA